MLLSSPRRDFLVDYTKLTRQVDPDELIEKTNQMLETTGFGAEIFQNLPDLIKSSSSMFVAIYERLTHKKLEKICRIPENDEDYINNLQVVIQGITELYPTAEKMEMIQAEQVYHGNLEMIEKLVEYCMDLSQLLHRMEKNNENESENKYDSPIEKSQSRESRKKTSSFSPRSKEQCIQSKKKLTKKLPRNRVKDIKGFGGKKTEKLKMTTNNSKNQSSNNRDLKEKKIVKPLKIEINVDEGNVDQMKTIKNGRFVPQTSDEKLSTYKEDDKVDNVYEGSKSPFQISESISSLEGASFMNENKDFLSIPDDKVDFGELSGIVDDKSVDDKSVEDNSVDDRSVEYKRPEGSSYDKCSEIVDAEATKYCDKKKRKDFVEEESEESSVTSYKVKNGSDSNFSSIKEAVDAISNISLEENGTSNETRNSTKRFMNTQKYKNLLRLRTAPNASVNEQLRYKTLLKDHLHELRVAELNERRRVETEMNQKRYADQLAKIRALKLRHDLKMRRIALGLQEKIQSEKALRQAMKQVLSLEEERLREQQRFADDEVKHMREKHSSKQQSLRKFYEDQLRELQEQSTKQIQSRSIYEKAQKKASEDLLREIREEKRRELDDLLQYEKELADAQLAKEEREIDKFIREHIAKTTSSKKTKPNRKSELKQVEAQQKAMKRLHESKGFYGYR